ncbi:MULTISPECIES: hypothetical protein [Pseudomonas]|uniref:Uncharacterized protein n=1 Tax=Pseudomonas syringae TaxID=317 RepID=A0A085UZ57_PSESX|nr:MULTISPECIES: hypothetical protein [Pseudomonas]EPJ87932.1 hypothetical protein CFII64_05685 [Pseudomonas sp. CFII64]KFE48470.1 hypothetical protein IV02_21605 [Pseudomonas syringae]
MKDIQKDLQTTANDLESISLNLAGHAVFLQHSIHARDAADVSQQVIKLQDTVDDLRTVADRIKP